MTCSKRLCIIGGGPGGLATARVFLSNSSDYEISLFESDHNIGGVWHYEDGDKDGRVMYDHLETNINKTLMQFSGFPFPDNIPTFPHRSDVYEYLKDYYKTFIADDPRFHVKFNTRVQNVSKNGDRWVVNYKKHDASDSKTEEFDFVVVANGHFETPAIPDSIKNLNQWFENDAAIHAKDFYNCEFAKGKNVIVVGNGSSGQDMTVQLSTVAKKVYNSVTDMGPSLHLQQLLKENVELIDSLETTDYAKKTVQTSTGTRLENIDYIVTATGYLYNLSFLSESLRKDLFQNRELKCNARVYGVWEQIFYTKDPTLAISLLPQLIVPFPLAELQACLMVKVFNKQLKVPNEALNDTSETSVKYHKIVDDVEYYRRLQQLLDGAGGQNDSLKPIQWTEELQTLRTTAKEHKRQRNVKLVHYSKQLKSQNKSYQLIPKHLDN